MPIVAIEIVLRANEVIRDGIASELADELGRIFDSPSAGTWVKVHGLSADQYAENGGTPEDINPVFVTIIKSEKPSSEAMQKEVERITRAVAQICVRPAENVHVIYELEAKGRVAFGGKPLF